MGKFYAVITGVVILALGALYTLITYRRGGMARGAARERAREAIDEIRDAVVRGDDAEVQARLEDKIRGKR